MKTAPNWKKSFTARLGAIIALAPIALDAVLPLEPVLGDYGHYIISILGALVVIARAWPQDNIYNESRTTKED